MCYNLPPLDQWASDTLDNAVPLIYFTLGKISVPLNGGLVLVWTLCTTSGEQWFFGK